RRYRPAARGTASGRRSRRPVGRTSPVTTRTRKKAPVGIVRFVGAGPGDPALLTVRAAALLAEADLVVRDPGIPPELLAGVAADRVVEAGVGEHGEPLTHAARARLAVDAAKEGRQVVRLLEGDPALFG